jgi:cytochrome P450
MVRDIVVPEVGHRMSQRFPPGPRGRWLTGCLREFMDRRLDFFTEIAREYGDVVGFRLGTRRVWLINAPELIEQVLVTDNKLYIKHFGARMYQPLLGNGLLLSEGEFWLRQRRLAQPAFLKNRVSAYAGAMVELTEQALESWHDGMWCDMLVEMSTLTSSIAVRTLFGTEDVKDRESFRLALDDASDVIGERFRRLIQWPGWMPLASNRRLKRDLRHLDSIVEGFIEQGRARGQDADNLLARLLHARDEDGLRMTDRQLRDELTTLFLAGHETTALTLAWTWWLLAQHPEVEAKLAAEWRQVLGGRSPIVGDLEQLPYTEQVIMESMRLYPPAYLIGREPTVTTELGGYTLPKGTTVFLAEWVTHRDPRFFDEPNKFRPERWGEPKMEKLPKYAYYPFGGGPRLCIGNHFAMMEAALVLATIGQRFRFTLEPEPAVEPMPMITLRPFPGIPVVLKRR